MWMFVNKSNPEVIGFCHSMLSTTVRPEDCPPSILVLAKTKKSAIYKNNQDNVLVELHVVRPMLFGCPCLKQPPDRTSTAYADAVFQYTWQCLLHALSESSYIGRTSGKIQEDIVNMQSSTLAMVDDCPMDKSTKLIGRKAQVNEFLKKFNGAVLSPKDLKPNNDPYGFNRCRHDHLVEHSVIPCVWHY